MIKKCPGLLRDTLETERVLSLIVPHETFTNILLHILIPHYARVLWIIDNTYLFIIVHYQFKMCFIKSPL